MDPFPFTTLYEYVELEKPALTNAALIPALTEPFVVTVVVKA